MQQQMKQARTRAQMQTLRRLETSTVQLASRRQASPLKGKKKGGGAAGVSRDPTAALATEGAHEPALPKKLRMSIRGPRTKQFVDNYAPRSNRGSSGGGGFSAVTERSQLWENTESHVET